MIFPLGGMVFGALLGVFGAKRRGGKPLDLAQWGGVLAILGGVIGMFALVFIERAAI